jgi:hypothetical protein
MIKVKVQALWIDYKEGSPNPLVNRIYARFADFNLALAQMAGDAPPGGAYDKVSFVVLYQDGEAYRGRFDLKREHAAGGPLLETHMRRELEYWSGRRSPPGWSPERHKRALGDIAEEVQSEAARWLDGYQIGDEDA